MDSAHYGIEDLCRLTGFSRRTIRFYIQQDLLPKPEGERRGAYYLDLHVEILLRIKRLTQQGLSLDAVRTLLQDKDDTPAPARPKPGTSRTCVHVTIAEGVEMIIDPINAKLDPHALRLFIQHIESQLQALATNPQDGSQSALEEK